MSLVSSKGQTILCIGDGLTEQENKAQVHMVYNGQHIVGKYPQPFGYGYVNMVRSFLLACYPCLRLRFVNKGIGGNNSAQVLERWDRDVLPAMQ